MSFQLDTLDNEQFPPSITVRLERKPDAAARHAFGQRGERRAAVLHQHLVLRVEVGDAGTHEGVLQVGKLR